MAKFLETQAISNELMKIIKEAKEKIILVSPFLKVNTQVQERLRTKSKIGTLGEIAIIYGKSDLKNSELQWIQTIDDLKVFEKSNLHAKCYLNEEKAIICSMNLYDYSQQNNIEMGLLISKEHDKEAYDALIEEINNIKVNGIRKRFDVSGTIIDQKVNIENNTLQNQVEKKQKVEAVEFTPLQKLKIEILKEWRLNKSKSQKTKEYDILTNEEINLVAQKEKIDTNAIFDILPKKKAIQYAEDIYYQLKNADYYTLGKVLNVWYQDNSSSYDRVKIKNLLNGEEKWFDTTKELPLKDKIVAVKINKTWFNEYFYLDN